MKIPENISVKSDTTDLRILKSTFGNFHPLMSKLATKDPVLIRIKQNDFNFRAKYAFTYTYTHSPFK